MGGNDLRLYPGLLQIQEGGGVEIPTFRKSLFLGTCLSDLPPSVTDYAAHLQDMGTLMMADHMKRVHGVYPDDVRYYLGDSKGGVRQVPGPEFSRCLIFNTLVHSPQSIRSPVSVTVMASCDMREGSAHAFT